MKKNQIFAVIFFLLVLTVLPLTISGNEMQRLILDTGINLGLWATQVELFNSPSNNPAITSYATNAFNAVTMVRDRLTSPFNNIDLQSVLNQITRYPNYTARWNTRQRVTYVRNIYTLLRARLSVLYLSTRGIYYSPNCDSAFLDVGYYLGRAQMGTMANNQYVRANGRSSMLNAIRNGLQSSQNIGCGFNLGNNWNSLQINRANTTADFQRLVEPIRGIADNATQVFTNNAPLSPSFTRPSTPPPPPPPGPTASIIGTWRMGDNATVVFRRSGNSFVGTIHNLTSTYTRMGYREGMQYFKFSGGARGVYNGQVIVRSSSGQFNWKGCRVTIRGNSATFSDQFSGGRVSYTASKIL